MSWIAKNSGSVLMWTAATTALIGAHLSGRYDGYRHGLEDGWNLAVYQCRADVTNCLQTTEKKP